jgi:uncharacterized protein (TIGR04255 family)
MSDQPYKKPPITEAVIEVRFATALDASDLDKTTRQMVSVYNQQESIKSVDFAVGVPPEHGQTTALINEQLGRRMSSGDLTEILVLWPLSFVVAQLAPYPGWEVFFDRFSRDWNILKKTTEYRRIVRVGVRFINRIDVPFTTNGVIEEAEYLNVYPQLPASFGPVNGYGVQAQLPMRDIGCKLTINSAAVPSPLIAHNSFLLDLDIHMEASPPQNNEDIYELLNRIRVKKNQVFEACITARSREIFRA